ERRARRRDRRPHARRGDYPAAPRPPPPVARPSPRRRPRRRRRQRGRHSRPRRRLGPARDHRRARAREADQPRRCRSPRPARLRAPRRHAPARRSRRGGPPHARRAEYRAGRLHAAPQRLGEGALAHLFPQLDQDLVRAAAAAPAPVRPGRPPPLRRPRDVLPPRPVLGRGRLRPRPAGDGRGRPVHQDGALRPRAAGQPRDSHLRPPRRGVGRGAGELDLLHRGPALGGRRAPPAGRGLSRRAL
ncbi:MAG: FIG00636748: hypothetical protein, partial [uncultured Sphingomonadaceae bacterium]